MTLMTLTIAIIAMAQRSITGKVIENDSQDPVAQTTVRLLKTDSTMVKGVLTDLNGQFSLKAPATGRYIIQVTCVGFNLYQAHQCDSRQECGFGHYCPFARCYYAERSHRYRTCSQGDCQGRHLCI